MLKTFKTGKMMRHLMVLTLFLLCSNALFADNSVRQEAFFCQKKDTMPPQKSAYAPMNRVTLRDLQKALILHGYKLKVTNRMDKATKKAFLTYVTDNGIPTSNVSGFFNSEMLSSLGFPPNSVMVW